MPAVSSCPECGVPDYVGREHLWLDNGDIVHSRDRSDRVAFIESDNIDSLLEGIKNLVGVSIEHIVITCVARNIREPLALFVPNEERQRILRKETDYRGILDTFAMISEIMGRGRLEVVDLRYEQDEDDFCTFRMTEPFSVPLCCGARIANLEAILRYDHNVTCEEVAEDVYLMTVFPSKEPEGLEGRMAPVDYAHSDGGNELEKCPACGAPKPVSMYRWHPDRGVILNESTGHRMVLMAPRELDAVFQELADELGETIPRTVVEAQRRFTKTGFFDIGELSEENLRLQLTYRGLGNLRDFESSRKGLSLMLDNAVLPLMLAGTLQGLYEMEHGVETTVDWELSDDGSLSVGLSPVD